MTLTPQTKRDLLLLVLVLSVTVIVATLTYIIVPPAPVGDESELPSTFFNTRFGTKAAFLVLDELGYDVVRFRRPIDEDTLRNIDALVLLQPGYCVTQYEARRLKDWVWNGGKLLVAPPTEFEWSADEDGWAIDECSGPSDWFEYAETGIVGGLKKLIGGDEPETHWDCAFATPDTYHTTRFDPETPLLWPSEDLPINVLWRDERGVVAFETQYGAGRIIALADVYALTNGVLAQGDHALWLATLTEKLTDGNATALVAFDEYHAGFPHEPNTWIAIAKLLWDERWAWATSQAVLIAVLALYAAGARFGRPRTVPPSQRRTQGEFTQAAGRFLRAARARDVVTNTLVEHYRQRLHRALQLAPDASPTALQNAVLQHGRPQWLGWMVEMTGSSPAASEADLLRRVQRMEEMLEAFEHGLGKGNDPGAAHPRRTG